MAFYDQRGEAENWIKELKEGFGMDWMPCWETYANAVYFRIGVIAYNLFVEGTEPAQSMAAPSDRDCTLATVPGRRTSVLGKQEGETSARNYLGQA